MFSRCITSWPAFRIVKWFDRSSIDVDSYHVVVNLILVFAATSALPLVVDLIFVDSLKKRICFAATHAIDLGGLFDFWFIQFAAKSRNECVCHELPRR